MALLVGLAVQLIPVIIFPTVLTQDGPAHVDSAWVLVHRGDDDAVGALLREHYRIALNPVPNMFTTLVLATLLPALGPDLAERVLVAGFVIALVAALGYALRGVDRRAGWLAVAALPFAGSHLVVFGFYNFCWGIVGALLVVGLALRRRRGWSVPAVAGLTLLLVSTWTAHLLPYALAAASALALALARMTAAVAEGTAPPTALRRHVLPVALSVVPSAILTVAYLLSGHGPAGTPVGGISVGRMAALLSGVHPFVVGSAAEWPSALATVVALVMLARATAPRSIRRAGAGAPARLPERQAFGVLLVGATLAYCLTPERLGTEFGFLDDRLAWFPPLLLVLWAATGRPAARPRALVAAVLVVAASTAVLVRLPAQAAAAGDVAELLSVADRISPASTFVILRYAGPAPAAWGIPDPLRHESSRLAVRAASVDVGHYEAVHPYFQVTFAGGPDLRRQIDPGLDGLEQVPPVVDLSAARGRLDYVAVLGLDGAGERVRAAAATREVVAELSAHYEKVTTSSPTGLVTLWRARG